MKLRLLPASHRVLILAVVCCVAALVAVFAASTSEEDATTVDPAVYKEFMSNEVFGVEELDQWFVDQQFNWLPLMPPAEDFILRQPSGQVLPFDSKQFPPEFVKGLIPSYLNTVPAYRLTIVEDPKTRQTLFFNEKGQQVFALQPVPGYNPLWFLKDYRPELFSGHYTPWYVDFMSRLYDPSHVQAEVTLIPSEYSEQYLYAQQLIAQEAAMLALAASSGGGSILMRYSGPPVSNITFTAIERMTNLIRVTLAYPYSGATYPTNCFTNRLDIFQSPDLLESWWDLAVTTNVSPSTNWIEWTDTSVTASWITVRFYAAGNADIDSDGDGFSDARETFMYHSDPNNPTSKPVSVSGSVSYSGSETGTIYALATTSSDGWSLGCSTAISGPGSYSNAEVATLRSYWFKAFRDVNANSARDAVEPWGIYSTSSMLITNDTTGINVTMQDVPSISGTIDYTGTQTGDIHVVAIPISNSWDTTYSCMIPWVQGATDMTGGITYVTFPVGYTIVGMPTSNYWIRAFIDSDTNLAYTHLEAAGQYTSNAIPVSNRVTGINFTLDQDSDNDQMPDWWEWQYGLDPANSNDAFMDKDNDGAVNIAEYHYQMDPTDTDTDDDSILDGWEFLYGLNPLMNDATNDNDGDGFNNLTEYQRGTYPNNPDSDGDTITDGPLVPTGSVGLVAGADPNPLVPCPGYLRDAVLSSVVGAVRIGEDDKGRPIIAWLGFDDSQKNQVYVMKWFGTTPPVAAGDWGELNGLWEAFGDSALAPGITHSTNGVGAGFDLAIDSTGCPVVVWSEVHTGLGDLYLVRWSGTNWVEVGGSDSGAGISGGTTNNYSVSPSVALDSVDRPVVSWSEYPVPSHAIYSIRLKAWNGTNWVALAESTNNLDSSGTYCGNSCVRINQQDRPVVAWQYVPSYSHWSVYSKQWSGSAWQSLGQVDAGTSDDFALPMPDVSIGPDGLPNTAWIFSHLQAGSAVFLRKYTNSAWQGYGGSDSGAGLAVGTDAYVYCQTLWRQTNGQPAVVWCQSQPSTPVQALMAKIWNPASTQWVGIGSSLSGTGIKPNDRSVIWAEMTAGAGTPVVVSAEQIIDGGSDYHVVVRQYAKDSDGDGLSDGYELLCGTSSTNSDTDADGLSDYDEVMYYGTSATTNDTDGDGISDAAEVLGTLRGVPSDPLSSDTDGDGIMDGSDWFINSPFGDQDGDGIPDSLDNDADNDGLTNGLEQVSITNCPYWLNPDSDGDGYPDGVEYYGGSSPCSNSVPVDTSPPVIYITEPEEGATL